MDMLPKQEDGIQWLVKKIEQFPTKKDGMKLAREGPCLKDLDEINIPQAILWLLSSIFVRRTDAVDLKKRPLFLWIFSCVIQDLNQSIHIKVHHVADKEP